MGLGLAALLLLGLLLLASCSGESNGDVAPSAPGEHAGRAWLDVELQDVMTGERFRISDFSGRPVFVESFAVWCPTCRSQLLEMKEVLERTDAVLVALDTDPNENEQKVREHVVRNGFTGHFAVAPSELTSELLEEFGPEIVAVPAAPVVLVSEDQSRARLLERGVKSADALTEVLEEDQ
ncbi:MAG: hypothetical protein Kow00129_00690 [Thermoleophilia bacterium]